MQAQKSSTTDNAYKNIQMNLGAKLLSFTENKTFSDICIISSDNKQFHVHKCVLSAFSDYFMVMFTGGLKEAKASQVKIQEVNGKVFELLLTFMYTGQIKLENETMQEIFRLAFFFQIRPLMAKCLHYMENNMNCGNCLSIANFATKHDMTDLYKKALKFASENFEKVSKYKDFLKLNTNTLLEIVSSADLRVTTEEAVFLNLIKWINYDKPNREKTAFHLISKIRYQLLNVDFIKSHRSQLPYQIEYMELVCTWLEYHSSSKNRGVSKVMGFQKPIVDGIISVSDRRANCSLSSNIWTREEPSKLPHQFDNIVSLEQEIVFSCEGHRFTCFNSNTQEIKLLPPMKVPRKGYGLAVLDRCLYVIGGYNDKHEWQNVVERFHFDRDTWEDVPSMKNILISPKATACSNRHQVYVVGDESLTMECFDSLRNMWTSKRFHFN